MMIFGSSKLELAAGSSKQFWTQRRWDAEFPFRKEFSAPLRLCVEIQGGSWQLSKKHDLNVADIRRRRPGHDEVAEALEKGVGIVVGEVGVGLERQLARAFRGGRIDVCAGGVGRSVDGL